jgi:riboflavin synthase
MFTGIIEGLGTVVGERGRGGRLKLQADFSLEGTRIGDSIAVSGACLTVVALGAGSFEVDLSPETLRKTTFGRVKHGERVNLERSLKLGDRLDGHLVSGHIDGCGTIVQRQTLGNAVGITVEAPPELTRYMIVKGSVAVDGVSLTINRLNRGSFEVSIIPHTARLTTIGFKPVGAAVNIETDLLGKYVERFLTGPDTAAGRQAEGRGGVDLELLAKSGFLS